MSAGVFTRTRAAEMAGETPVRVAAEGARREAIRFRMLD
jgi:hypothetical protein